MTRHDLPLIASLAARRILETGEASEVVVWSVDPAQGWVQGPLDLGFFAPRTLVLDLRDDQIALRVRGGEVQAVLLGNARRTLAPAIDDERIYFLHTDLELPWRLADGAEIWAGAGTARRPVPVIGSVGVAVADPVALHAAFLRGVAPCDDAHVRHVVDTLVRSRIEARLDRADDDAAVQTRLAHLASADLSEDLAEFGLSCTRIAVYTREAPVEEAGWTFRSVSR